MFFRGVPPKKPAPGGYNPFDILAMMDELRKMFAEFKTGLAELQTVQKTIEAIKKGSPGLPGTPGLNGKNVNPEDVHRAVKAILVQPKDGVAPTAREIADEVLKDPKLYKFILKRFKQEDVDEKTAEDTEEADELVTIKQMMEEEITKIRKEMENRMAETRNFVATQGGLAGKKYGEDTWARGGGDIVQAGTGVTITNSGGKKIINATGSAFQAPSSGVVDGSNKTFVFATAPNVIVVDQGRAMRKTSSDGTANWTGTTTVILTIAPNNDVYATA